MKRHQPPGKTLVTAALAISAFGVPLILSASPTQAAGAPPAPAAASALSQEQRTALTRLTGLSAPAIYVDAKTRASDDSVDVIVELRQGPAASEQARAAAAGRVLSAATAQREAKEAQGRFKQFLTDTFAAKSVTYNIRKTYSDAYNGFALSISGKQLDRLLESADVAAVWEDALVREATPAVTTPTMTTIPINTAAVPAVVDASAEGVRRLHAEGVTGKGLKVAILDTGIDYNHPALKDVYKGGYDFVNDDSDPMETTYADWKASGRAEKDFNGNTYYTRHGSHVAGIIAGKPVAGADAMGIAPEADLYSYRVLGPYGGGTTSNILAGMDRALKDGANVVNMSLGANLNNPHSPLSAAADNLTLAGVTTVLAAGNDGQNGAFSLGSPAASALSITVGANDTPVTVPTLKAAVGSGTADLRLLAQPFGDALTPLVGSTSDIIDVGRGLSADYSGKVVTGKVVFMRRGDSALENKITLAKTKGAKAVLLANNLADEGFIPYYLGEGLNFLPTFTLTMAGGTALTDQLAAGATQVTLSDLGTTTFGGGILATFSSRGPAKLTNDIKPEITAPGVSILSSVPPSAVDTAHLDDYTNAYQRLSGTSMATPYAAGVAALVLQARPGLKPHEVKVAFMNTADALATEYGVFEMGAGQLDPYQAVHAATELVVQDRISIADGNSSHDWIPDLTGGLGFGLHATGEVVHDKRDVTVSNKTDQDITYSVRTVYSTSAGVADAAANGVRVSVPSDLRVKAKANMGLTVRLDVPATAAKGSYSGYLLIEGGNAAYRMPFGFRVADKGIAALTALKPVMSTRTENVYSPQLSFAVNLKSHMRNLDAYIVDPASGQDIGYLGALDPIGMREDVNYGPFAWTGKYFPITKDPRAPLGNRLTVLGEGHYQLRMVGTDDSDQQYSAITDFYVDNTPPKFTTALDGQRVVEVPNGATKYALNGSVIDGEVDKIKAAGIAITQADNLVLRFTFSTIQPSSAHAPQADGTFALTPSFGPSPSSTDRYAAIDMAGNVGGRREFLVIKEGAPYIDSKSDKLALAPDQMATHSFTGQNADQWGEVKVTLRYSISNTELGEIRKPAALAAYSTSPLVITKNPLPDYPTVQITIPLDGPQVATGDNLPLLEVETIAKDGNWAAATGFMTVSVTAKKRDGTSVNVNRLFDSVEMLNPTALLRGAFVAQGLLTEDSAIDNTIDYSTIGAAASLTAPDGTVTQVPVSANRALSVDGVAIAADPHLLTVSIPGHFTSYVPVASSFVRPEGLGGRVMAPTVQAAAGDVNNDSVIDILDAIAIRDARGTSTRAADINFDGTVDAADLRFVVINFLLRNPEADTAPYPQSTYRGVTLEAVKATFN